MHDKPFFVSEWDNSWPNEWRAESSLLLAAIGVFQGWGGYAIHTYRYSLDENVDMIAKPITSNAIGGISYRAGLFDTFNDPAKFGLFYHAALITRRGDVKPAGKTAVVKINDLSTSMRPKPTVNALDLITEKHRVGVALPDSPPVKADIVLQQDEVIEEVKKREVLSDTKELYRNLDKKIGWIDSPNTKAVYGFVGEQGEITLNNLKINAKTDFATIALSTLTDDPISNSENMLLTTVGRADNTNAEYNEDHTLHIEVGHGPILVEVIEATIEITTDVKNLRVMAINPQGVVIGYVPSEYKDGKFSFETGKHFPSMYYLIQAL